MRLRLLERRRQRIRQLDSHSTSAGPNGNRRCKGCGVPFRAGMHWEQWYMDHLPRCYYDEPAAAIRCYIES